MKKEDLKETTKLEVLLLIKNSNFPKAMTLVMNELKCGLRIAKEIVDQFREEEK
jgi:hypothetical protein